MIILMFFTLRTRDPVKPGLGLIFTSDLYLYKLRCQGPVVGASSDDCFSPDSVVQTQTDSDVVIGLQEGQVSDHLVQSATSARTLKLTS